MVNQILIPVDGSSNSSIALEYGLYIAPKFNASLIGLHVVDIYLIQGPVLTDISGAVGMPPYDGFFEAVETSLNEKAEAILKDFKIRSGEAGVVCDVKKSIGKISDVIIEEAQEADWIVMAKKGEHFHLKEGGLLGSVAEGVIRKSGKPVLITPERFIEIESMGLAFDGSEPAQKALALSLAISKQAHWPLSVIMVNLDESRAAEFTTSVEDAAQEKNVDCEVIQLSGKEPEAILNFINQGSIELMVMGAYGHNRLRQLLLGSTTSQVISKSPVPVLLTR
ncbi:MAG: universal stress protein [Smithellaceae bacterium]